MLHLENSFLWCWKLDNSGSGSEMPVKFLNVVLEKDGEEHLVLSFEKWRSNVLLLLKESYEAYSESKYRFAVKKSSKVSYKILFLSDSTFFILFSTYSPPLFRYLS